MRIITARDVFKRELELINRSLSDHFDRLLLEDYVLGFDYLHTESYHKLVGIEKFDEDSFRTVFIAEFEDQTEDGEDYGTYLVCDRQSKSWYQVGFWSTEFDRPSITFRDGKSVGGAW